MKKSNGETLLLTGGSGRLGRQITELLLAQGVGRLIVTTRSPDKLSRLAPRGVEVRKLDFDDDAANVARAFAGADRVLVISSVSIGRRAEQMAALVAGARQAKVSHLLYTSVVSPSPSRVSEIVADHFWSEQAIMGSGIPWTMLRHNMYTEHVLLFLPPALKARRLRTSLGSGARAYIARDDCARADAAALAGKWTDCRVYDIGGPEAISTDGLLAITKDLTGVGIEHVCATDAEALAEFAANDLPPGFPESAVGFDMCARYGYHAIISPAVEELSGVSPESVRSYLERNVDVLLRGSATVEL
jgi:NAD(P)H dehydrogenase (quinone)